MKNRMINLKSLTLLIALFISSCQLFAQSEKTWSLGPELGASLSRYSADDHKFKAGFIGGASLNYSIVNTYGITGKLLFHQKGSSAEVNGATNKQTLNYLELPITGRVFLNQDGRFRPNVFIGPTFGYLLSVNNKIKNDESTRTFDSSLDNFKRLEVGVTAGVGLNYLIAYETRLLLDARYTQGITDIQKSGNLYNRGFALTLGMSFGIF